MGRLDISPTDEWFESYKNFIVKQADLANQLQIDLFVIGVELPSTINRTDKWLEIISAVRQHYHGPISYAALACNEWAIRKLWTVKWFSHLDYLGLSANLETRSGSRDPTLTELVLHYTALAKLIKQLQQAVDKPVMIFEASIFSVDGATSYRSSTIPDFQEQADFFEAFLRTFSQYDWVAGIFTGEWQVWFDPENLRRNSGAFYSWLTHPTFAYKPAERVVAAWYGNNELDIPGDILAPPQSASPSDVIFKEDFEDFSDSGTGWSIQEEDGNHFLRMDTSTTSRGAEHFHIMVDGSLCSTTSHRLKWRMRLLKGRATVYFLHPTSGQAPFDHYFISFEPRFIELFKKENGRDKRQKRIYRDIPAEWLNFTIEVRMDQDHQKVTLLIGSDVVHEFKTDRLMRYGKFGFLVDGYSKTDFDDIEIAIIPD